MPLRVNYYTEGFLIFLCSTGSSHSNGDKKGNNVSRVDSFRNFFLSTASTTLKTPRAVKRRSRNTEKHRSNNTASCNSKLLVDASTTTSTGESSEFSNR